MDADNIVFEFFFFNIHQIPLDVDGLVFLKEYERRESELNITPVKVSEGTENLLNVLKLDSFLADICTEYLKIDSPISKLSNNRMSIHNENRIKTFYTEYYNFVKSYNYLVSL